MYVVDLVCCLDDSRAGGAETLALLPSHLFHQ